MNFSLIFAGLSLLLNITSALPWGCPVPACTLERVHEHRIKDIFGDDRQTVKNTIKSESGVAATDKDIIRAENEDEYSIIPLQEVSLLYIIYLVITISANNALIGISVLEAK
jgi:hypothetical protein